MNITNTNLSFISLTKRKSTRRIILHHAAAKTCNAATIHRWHKDRGWSGIGYHFLVRKNGRVERGRPENMVGAHASGSNSDSIGICFEGNFMTETMKPEQLKAGQELVSYLKKKYGVTKVQKHSDVGSTSCPGKNFPFSKITASVSSSGSSSAGKSSPSAGYPTLKKGSRGSHVRLLQARLTACGYSCGSYGADGIFGACTKKAVIAFQKEYHLSPDGIVGPLTWGNLLSGGK